jgi:hypothetical protein
MGLDQQIRSGDTDAKVQAVAFSGFGGATSVIRNLNDAILSEDEMEEGAVSILNNFGVPVEAHLDPMSLSVFSRQFFPKERIPNMGVADGRAGFVLREFVSSAGAFALKPNVFLRPKAEYKTAADASSVVAAPAVPVTANGGADVGTTFALGESYTWRVASVMEQGESAASVPCAADVVTTAGEVFTVTITNVAGAKAYAVYRSNDAGAAASEQFIGYVRATPGANTVFTDANRKLPGRAEAFLLFMDPEALMFKQLSPLAKINLATAAASFEWLQVLYGCLIVFTPRKHFIWENLGRS